MKKTFLFCILVFSTSSICFAQSNYTESLTITTYYPAPYGVYRNLKLNPTTTVPSGTALSAGVMYYDNNPGMDMIRYYNSTGKWVNLTDGGGTGPSGIGNVITVSGANPACPSGATTLMREWTAETFPTCFFAGSPQQSSNPFSGGWSKPAPVSYTGCGFFPAPCSPVGNIPCYPNPTVPGSCICAAQNWTMVMCSQ